MKTFFHALEIKRYSFGIPVISHNVGSCNRLGKVTFVGMLLLLLDKSAEVSVDCCVCGSR